MTLIDLETAREVLAAQPFSRLLGTRVVAVEPETVILELDVDDRLLQQYGFVHGGVLSYLADNALTYAGALGLGPNVITSGCTVDYIAPARQGGTLRATGRLVGAGRTKATTRCDVEQVTEDGVTLCATALGTILRVAPRDDVSV